MAILSTKLPTVWSSPLWECRPEMEEMARKIRETNHWNGNRGTQAEKSSFPALRRSRGWRDLRQASRSRWWQRLQRGSRETNRSFLPASQYNVQSLRQAKQKDGETLHSFHTRLQTLAKTCDLANPDNEIKKHTILNCQSNSPRRKALRVDLDLLNLDELNEISAKEFENHDKIVNVVQFNTKNTSKQPKGKERHP